jgi:hypothetical protein
MHIVKTKLHNKIEYDFLAYSLMLHIKREIVAKLSTNLIIDDFRDIKERRVPFWLVIKLKIEIY